MKKVVSVGLAAVLMAVTIFVFVPERAEADPLGDCLDSVWAEDGACNQSSDPDVCRQKLSQLCKKMFGNEE